MEKQGLWKEQGIILYGSITELNKAIFKLYISKLCMWWFER